MTAYPHVSPIQFVQQPDGSMQLKDLPGVKLETVEAQGKVTGRDWQAEVGFPHYYEEWEEMARVRGLGARQLRFIVADQSPTNFPGHPRLQPQQITLPKTCPLELGHSSFLVGTVFAFIRVEGRTNEDLASSFGFDLPEGIEGDFIIGQAQLFDSPLAEKAWQGIERGIFTHVCPNIFRPTGAPQGTGRLVQVTLAPGDYPGCPAAKILEWWEGA